MSRYQSPARQRKRECKRRGHELKHEVGNRYVCVRCHVVVIKMYRIQQEGEDK